MNIEKDCSNCIYADDGSRGYFTGCPFLNNGACSNYEYWVYRFKEEDRVKRSDILDEAKKCVCGQREQDYGSPEDNFKLIANLWSTYLGTGVSALDVSNMMILLKLARIKNGGGTGDSFVDIAGYAACGGEINETVKKAAADFASEVLGESWKKDPVRDLMNKMNRDAWAQKEPKKSCDNCKFGFEKYAALDGTCAFGERCNYFSHWESAEE